RKDLAPLARHWKWILVYTAVEVAAPWFLLSDAERRISSSLTGLLIAATPSLGAILAWATSGQDRLDRRRIVGLAVGFVGVAALAFVLFFALIAVAGSARATVITYVNPAVALALGVALLSEPLTVGIAIGSVLVVLGSILATRRAPPSTSESLTQESARPIRSSP